MTAIRWERSIALALALAGLAGLAPVARLAADLVGPSPDLHSLLLWGSILVTSAVAQGLAAWIAWRGPDTRAASALALALALGAAGWSLGILLLVLAVVSADSKTMALGALAGWSLGLYASAWSLARFFACFPEPLTEARLTAAGVAPEVAARATRWIDRTTSAWSLLAMAIVLALLIAGAQGLIPALGALRHAASLVLLFAPLVPLAVGLLTIERQRRAADAVQRRRLRWVWTGAIGGFALWAACALAAMLFAESGERLGWMMLAFFGGALWFMGCLAIAVLARGDLDADLALRRALVYSALGLTLSLGFVALQSLLQEHVLGVLGVPPGVGTAFAGAAIAMSFGPLQRRFDAFLARRLARGQ
jgi:hypothetical protein